MPLPITFKASAQFIDRDFQVENIKNYRLSIQLRLDGFSFAYIDSLTNKVLSIEDYRIPLMLGDEAIYQNEKVNLRLEDFFAEKKIISQYFKSVHIVIDNTFSTIVPSILFDIEHADEYLKQVQQLPENFMVKTNELSLLDSHNVFAVYAPLFFTISDQFENFDLKHSSTVFIQQTAVFQKSKKDASVYVELGESSMFIIAFENDKLLLSNTFAFKEKEDFIYFILLVYSQLNFKPETVPLVFSGNIDRSSPLYAIAYQYIGYLDFIKPQRNGLVFGSDIPVAVGAKYQILTQAVLCE